MVRTLYQEPGRHKNPAELRALSRFRHWLCPTLGRSSSVASDFFASEFSVSLPTVHPQVNGSERSVGHSLIDAGKSRA